MAQELNLRPTANTCW